MILTLLPSSYLTDRKQYVHMQEHNSSLVDPETFVSQGPILGLLLSLYL